MGNNIWQKQYTKNDTVTITDYKRTYVMKRQQAIKHFIACSLESEGAEKDHYTGVLMQLYSGRKEIYDYI